MKPLDGADENGAQFTSKNETLDVAANKERDDCIPSWLRWMARPKALLVFLCCFTASQGFAVNGINNVNTTSMERRYRLPSSEVGIVSSAYDISAGLSVIFVSYFGTHAHKPRLLGFAALSLAAGSMVMTLPHFAAGVYEPSCAKTEGCKNLASQNTAQDCATDDAASSGLQSYLYVFIAGQVLHGLGGTCLYTLGTAFLDENVPTKSSPLFMGLLLGFSGFGPAIGYLLGGVLLDIYVDTPLQPPDNMTPSDPRWVGAWWIGFTMSCALFVCISVVMFLLPRELPGCAEIKAAKVSQAHGGTESDKAFVTIREFPAALLSLLKNPVFLFVSLAAASEGIITSGIATFLPKLLQNQFQLSSSFSAILAGLISVPGVAGGNIISGIVCRRMKLKVRGMLRVSIVCGIICMALSPTLFIKCESSFISTRNELNSACNAACECTTFSFKPVCSEGKGYFSPCFAGCNGFRVDSSSKNQIFTNCSCVGSNSTEASNGRCPTDCGQLPLFIPIMFLLVFSTFFSSIPGNGVTLRCVPDSQRTFGLGIQWVFVRFLGTIPGPILFGKIVDGTCLIWQELEDGSEGSCWTYDNSLMSLHSFILTLCIKTATLTFFSLAHYFYKPPPAMAEQRNASDAKLTLTSPPSSGDMQNYGYESSLCENISAATIES